NRFVGPIDDIESGLAAPILLAVAERYGFILIVLIEGEVGRGAISGCRALSRPHQAAVLVPLIVEEDQSRRLHTRSPAQRIRLAADDRLRQSRMIGDREPERAVRLAHVDAFDVDLVEFRARARLHECTGRHDRDENDRRRRCPPQAPNLAPQLLVHDASDIQGVAVRLRKIFPPSSRNSMRATPAESTTTRNLGRDCASARITVAVLSLCLPTKTRCAPPRPSLVALSRTAAMRRVFSGPLGISLIGSTISASTVTD